METCIRLRSLTKDYGPPTAGAVRAVDRIDLDIGPGEIVALLGPNGAGKTTTLDMILGFTAPSAGEVTVFDRTPRQAVADGMVSAVLQTGGLLRDLTVGETVELVASIYRGSTGPGTDAVRQVLERTLDHMAARGQDPLANLNAAIDASDGAIAGLAGRAVFGLHICRGNRASMWHREGHYDAIAEAVFGRLQFDRLLLEYDTERAGGFEPLRHVPKDTMVVLGLVTTKTGETETVDGLIARIEEATEFIDVEQLAISPQCGFASGISGNDLTPDEHWRKLDVLQQTADMVWG